jgi:hypothetical protein
MMENEESVVEEKTRQLQDSKGCDIKMLEKENVPEIQMIFGVHVGSFWPTRNLSLPFGAG